MPRAKYNFDFITLALGLIPIQNNRIAINTGAITGIFRDEHDGAAIFFHGLPSVDMTPEDMLELELTIKHRGEEAKAIQKEAMRNQLIAQQEVYAEINRSAQRDGIVIPSLTKKGRQ